MHDFLSENLSPQASELKFIKVVSIWSIDKRT